MPEREERVDEAERRQIASRGEAKAHNEVLIKNTDPGLRSAENAPLLQG